MPDDLLGSLQPPTLQSVMGQYPTAGQVGVGLAGLGHQTNPILAQEQDRFRQQVELIRLQQSVQKDRMARNKLMAQFGEDLMKSPEGRPMGAKVLSQAMGQMGELPQGVTPEKLETILSRQPLDDRTLQAIAQDFVLFPEDSDVAIAARRGVKSSEVADLRVGWGNKTTKRLLFPKLAEMELKEEEFQQRREDRQSELAQRSLQFQENQDLKRHLAEMSIEMRRSTMGLQRDKAIDKEMTKRRDALSSVATLQGINQKLVRALVKMNAAGALPSQPGLFADVAAKIARHTTLKNDPDVSLFLWFGTEQGISTARVYQKDIGVRSVAPFLAMLHGLMNPGPLQTMLPITSQWNTEMEIAKKAALTPGGLIGPQEVQELAAFFEKLNAINTQGIKVHGFQEVK